MDLGLEGKTALVTGASSHGIGRAIAKLLAAEGVQLTVAARRQTLLEQLVDEIVAAGGKKPHIVAIDLLQDTGPAKLAKETLEKMGSINILVNAAGGSSGRFDFQTPEEMWLREINLNFISIRRLSLAVAAHMIKNKWGRIINITGRAEPPRRGLYGTVGPKAALHSFSKGLSNELGRFGITVNCVAPGKILSEQIRRKESEAERREVAEKEIPVGRYGEPEELARVVAFLASPDSGFITGTVIPVDGGLRHYAF